MSTKRLANNVYLVLHPKTVLRKQGCKGNCLGASLFIMVMIGCFGGEGLRAVSDYLLAFCLAGRVWWSNCIYL